MPNPVKTSPTVLDSDSEFESHIIAKAVAEDSGWCLTFEDGWSIFMPNAGFQPLPRQTVNLYGRGTGYPVRGITVDGRVVFYRTHAEEAEYDLRCQLKRDNGERVAYEANADDYESRVTALPVPFFERITRFRAQNPSWRYKFEPYEMFACEQAVEIAKALKTEQAIRDFSVLEFAEQKKLVPALSDGHSGNTFYTACGMARIYLTRPELVPFLHGAMCPLVGCAEYGCVAVCE